MIVVEIAACNSVEEKYAMKIFNCPKCWTEHVYHWDSPRYCESQACHEPLPEINALMEMQTSRTAWHFGRY